MKVKNRFGMTRLMEDRRRGKEKFGPPTYDQQFQQTLDKLNNIMNEDARVAQYGPGGKKPVQLKGGPGAWPSNQQAILDNAFRGKTQGLSVESIITEQLNAR